MREAMWGCWSSSVLMRQGHAQLSFECLRSQRGEEAWKKKRRPTLCRPDSCSSTTENPPHRCHPLCRAFGSTHTQARESPLLQQTCTKLAERWKISKIFGKAFMRAKRATPRQASQVVAEGDGLRVYIFSFKEYSHWRRLRWLVRGLRH